MKFLHSYVLFCLFGFGFIDCCFSSKKSEISVSQTIQKSNTSVSTTKYNVAVGTNAFQLLEVNHKLNTTYFNGLGYFVNAIDGVFPKSNEYWEFVINNKSSDVGASNYTLKQNDAILWRISSFDGHN